MASARRRKKGEPVVASRKRAIRLSPLALRQQVAKLAALKGATKSTEVRSIPQPAPPKEYIDGLGRSYQVPTGTTFLRERHRLGYQPR